MTPQLGDYRTITQFALLPVEMYNGQYVWLKRYAVQQQYCQYTFEGAGPGWETMRFDAIQK